MTFQERSKLPARTFIDMPKSQVFHSAEMDRKKAEPKNQKFKDKFVQALTMGLKGKKTGSANSMNVDSDDDLSPTTPKESIKFFASGKKPSISASADKPYKKERKPLEDRAKVALTALIDRIDKKRGQHTSDEKVDQYDRRL